jgi:hypothetical protein
VIIFTIYFLVICVLIYKASFFGIFKDDVLNSKFFLTVFLIKSSALVAFYLIYTKLYGGIFYLDSGNFYRDSKVIHDIAKSNFGEFIKLMFGFQDDSEGSYIFRNFLEPTTTWDKTPGGFFYNDARPLLRFHALIHFISFGNYFVHALFSCLLSFIGINWVYKTFKNLFKDKEIYFFLIWILFPGVWFWTAGILKEGPALFLIGLVLVSCKRVILDKNSSVKNLIMFFVGIVMCVLYKQYLMIPLCVITLLFFSIVGTSKKAIVTKFLIAFLGIFFIGNWSMKELFQKDIVTVLSQRQRDFLDVSTGGIFLASPDRFVRVPYDYKLVRIDSSKKEIRASIKFGAAYWYNENTHIKDTIFVKSNLDTISNYALTYVIPKSYSTIKPPILDNTWISFLKAIPFAIYITTAKPFFVDARNVMDLVSSFENLLIILSLLLFLYNGFKLGFKNIWYIYFLSLTLVVMVLIGITSPNLGAIERYRSLVIPFILLTALLSSTIKDSEKLSNFFKNREAK